MKFFLKIASVILVILVFCVGCSRESNKTAKQLNDEAMVLLNHDQISDALDKAEMALKKAEKKYGQDNPQTAECMQTMALIYQAKGDINKAESYYKRALAVFLAKEGADSLDAAKTMNNLAGFYYAQKEYGKAASLFEKSLKIAQKRFPEGDPRLVAVKNNIDACKEKEAEKTGESYQANNENTSPTAPSEVADYVPYQVKSAAVQSFAKNNIHISDLKPEPPVPIGDQGMIFPYQCSAEQNNKKADGVKVIVLFAAVKNKNKKNAYVFQQSRLISYDAYMAVVKKGNIDLLRKQLVAVFPSLYPASN